MRNEDSPQIQQTSLAELHRLSITLSNLYDIAPTISITAETKTQAKKSPLFGRESWIAREYSHTADIDRAIELGKKYKISNKYAQHLWE